MHQGEGEQGDPCAPVLYAIGQNVALAALLAAQAHLQADEGVIAFLDDLYVLPRVPVARGIVAKLFARYSSFEPRQNTDVRLVPAPPEVVDLGPDVWRGHKSQRAYRASDR